MDVEWQKYYEKEMAKIRKGQKAHIRQKMIDDLKKEHRKEKEQEIEELKKRLAFLEQELQSLR